MTERLCIKVSFQEDRRRISVDKGATFADVKKALRTLFQTVSEESWTKTEIKYVDDEGDNVVLSTDAELAEAVRVADKQTREPLLKLTLCLPSTTKENSGPHLVAAMMPGPHLVAAMMPGIPLSNAPRDSNAKASEKEEVRSDDHPPATPDIADIQDSTTTNVPNVEQHVSPTPSTNSVGAWNDSRLVMLHSMGFSNTKKNIQVLMKTQGQIVPAVHILLAESAAQKQ